VEKGTSLSRTEVTRKINEYIKASNLQDPSDKRKIMPDEKLKTILNIVDGEQTNYFNLQKQLKHHFTKAE
jgi:upstream activation factor subunit UAF30